jgi:hypothetical protein
MIRLPVLALLLLTLSACVPAVPDPRPAVAVINAPAEWRITPLAEELEVLLRAEPAAAAFRFVFSEPLRFQEERRDMYGARAPLQAAFMAQVFGAEMALMVAAPRYERVVEPLFGNLVRVLVEVQVEVSLVDPDTAAVVASYRSSPVRLEELMSRRAAQREEAEDALRSEARRRALAELAPWLADELVRLLGRN